MPYIEIMLNVVWAFGKVKLEYDPFFLLVLSMEWILILCTELRPWYELSQNAVSGHGHVLRYCQLWLCGGKTHFELLFLTQSMSYWWWHSLRRRNSCLHENATLKNDLNRLFSISKCVIFNLSIANLLDSRQVATLGSFLSVSCWPLWILEFDHGGEIAKKWPTKLKIICHN